jgi:putative metallohydrolase (TIGR04338 family)
MRPRDNQRSRCYAWERAVVAAFGARFYQPDFATLEECEAFMNPIWRKERGRVGLAHQRAPELARNLWGQQRATASSNHVLKLPKWARSRWVILHEMAHRLTPADEAHGPRFVGVLIGLVCRWIGYDARRLMATADEMGLRYHTRSIGVVPVLGPSAYVQRALLAHPPMTAADLASHIAIVDETPLSVFQVRAAALTLIRNGHARWLRNKLTPTATENLG